MWTLSDTFRLMNDKKYEKKNQSSGLESFSDLFRLLNLTVDVYHNAKICGDWRVQEHALGATCFHMVTMGSLYPAISMLNYTVAIWLFFPENCPIK